MTTLTEEKQKTNEIECDYCEKKREKPPITSEEERPLQGETVADYSDYIKGMIDLEDSEHKHNKDMEGLQIIKVLLVLVVIMGFTELLLSNIFSFTTTNIFESAFEVIKIMLTTLLGYVFAVEKHKRT